MKVSGVPGLNVRKPVAAGNGEETKYVADYCATEWKAHATSSTVMVSVMLFITIISCLLTTTFELDGECEFVTLFRCECEFLCL